MFKWLRKAFIPSGLLSPTFEEQLALERERHRRLARLDFRDRQLWEWTRLLRYNLESETLDRIVQEWEEKVAEDEEWLEQNGYPVPPEMWRPV